MSYEYSFGEEDPKKMPVHFFHDSLRIDYSSAVQADTGLQNCSVCPRYWYVDAYFLCSKCHVEFCFSANEQRVWYEEYGIWIDSFPKSCVSCRRDLRALKAARKKYDDDVSATMDGTDLDAKRELAGVIDEIYELGGELPPRMNENRRILAKVVGTDGNIL